MRTLERSIQAVPAGFPCGVRTPRGKLRWYLVYTGEGREQSTCEKVKRLVDSSLLEDAFVMQRERWFKRAGAWSLIPVQMYRGYFFVATRDAAGLDKAFSKLSFPVQIAGALDHAYMPMSFDAQAWFTAAMDADHVLRNSLAVIVDGELRVQHGPLVGQERRVKKINRHKRSCLVSIPGTTADSTEQLPIDIPFKS